MLLGKKLVVPSVAQQGGPPEPTDSLPKGGRMFFWSILMQNTDRLDSAVLPWPGG